MAFRGNVFLGRALGFLSLLGVAATATAIEWEQRTVPMVGISDYMREVCVKFTAGDRVRYRFESDFPVNFDVHYHPEAGILFKTRKEAVTQIASEFTSESSQLYCFTWRNKREQGNEWKITLHFLITPE